VSTRKPRVIHTKKVNDRKWYILHTRANLMCHNRVLPSPAHPRKGRYGGEQVSWKDVPRETANSSNDKELHLTQSFGMLLLM
jgi:hypothetical protein